MKKRTIHMCLHCCLIMHSLDVTKHHPRSFQISFYHSFHQFHPISRTMYGHFEQEARLIKWLSWKTTSLYVVVCIIVFDTHYQSFYSRGLLNVNVNFNLVFISQRETIANTSNNVRPCNILPSWHVLSSQMIAKTLIKQVCKKWPLGK
jgi:hypothetical protein